MDTRAIARKAAFIDERIVVAPEAVDTDKGSERMKMLLNQYSPRDDDYESLFLREYGFNSPTDLSLRLGVVEYDSNTCMYSDVDENWVATLTRILQLVPPTEEHLHAENNAGRDAVEVFLRPFEQYVANALGAEVEQAASGFRYLRLNPKFVREFCEPPHNELKTLVTQTMILELHVAKYEHERDGSHYTLADFNSRMLNRSFYEHFFDEYATLGRRLTTRVLAVIQSRREMLERLLNDEPGIFACRLLDTCILSGVSFSAGDKHNGGRSVSVIHFEGGGGLVYKPRPMQAEAIFFDYIAQMSSDLNLSLKVPTCYCGTGYGWQEYVEHLPVDGHFAFAQFYQELGVLLAAAYAFGLTDLHHENIVAHGPHPVLIDAETLFAPQVEKIMRTEVSFAPDVSHEARTFNCLHTGILPTDQNNDAARVWGAAYSEGTKTPFDVPIIPAVDSMEAEIKYDRVEIAVEKNAPYYGSETGDWSEYESEVLEGFEIAYRYICADKSRLVERHGYVNRLRGIPVRVVLKGTMMYSVLLMTSNHPDYMREGTEVERLFSYVWRYPSLADPRIWFSELKQMRRLDVPYFSVPFSGTEVVDPDGVVVAEVQQELCSWWVDHINGFSDADLERQLWFIRASYVTSVAGENYELDRPDRLRPFLLRGFSGPETDTAVGTEIKASDAGRQIARRLCEKALLGSKGGWYSITVVGDERWSVQPVAMDLYNGNAGIGYALLYMGCALDEPDAVEISTSLADQTATFLRGAATSISGTKFTGEHPPYNDVGLYGAIGGGIYFLSHVSAMLGDDTGRYRESLAAIVEALLMRRPNRRFLDIVSGSAGLIEAMRSLYVAIPELREGAVSLVEIHGRHLCSSAERSKSGECSWQQDHMGKNALVGYSHGASGIVCALADASVLCGSAEFQSFIDGGMLFERRWRAARGFWPDLRDEFSSSTESPGMISWCHGAPGVALARLRLLENGYSSELVPRSDIVGDMLDAVEESVCRSILEGGSHFSTSMALCHGQLGTLEILGRIARHGDGDGRGFPESDAKKYLRQVDSYWHAAISRAYRDGVVCGVPRGLEVPGLMTGISGIGLSLMRYGNSRWDLPLVLSGDVPRLGCSQ
ncbi:Type 2 lantibiotic biosynthesis protein LanM [Actinomyces succiniciruminis]|uniref:Type 2 lantibiotic biosynthesis protein LanM n=2 Tax=Actinomyces succiniciruminis TaxID=1522002 RepID=A0A1L7RPE1_9ACTO|nr:Type 2 lantibiotic biosynthesis protein LanM [Actinomyces succiniciruminis]